MRGSISASLKRSFKDYDIPGTRVRIAGQDVYTTTYRGVLMDLYLLANGTHVGLLADELEWLSNTADVPAPDDCHISGVRLMFRVAQTGSGENISAAVIGDVTHTVTPHKYGTDPQTHELVNVPAVTEPGDPILLAIVMATKYGEA